MSLLGSIVGAVGSIAGGILGKKAQGSSNAANMQMASDANAMNLDMFNASNQINWEMFNAANAYNELQSQYALNFAREEAMRAEAVGAQGIRDQNAYNDPAAQRARAEAAGFNPLGMVSGVPQGSPAGGIAASGSAASSAMSGAAGYAAPIAGRVDPVNSMSSAIADASQIFGEGISAEMAEKSDNTKLRQANAELAQKLGEKTLRPKVGGLFGGGDIPAIGFGNAQIAQPSVASLLNGEDEGSVLDSSPRPPFIDRENKTASNIPLDERPPVTVFNSLTNKWTNIPAQDAEQMKLKNGMHLQANHVEDYAGESVAEAYGLGGMADVILGNSADGVFGDPPNAPEFPDRKDKVGIRHLRPASPPKKGSKAHNSILEHERKRRQRGF